MMSLSASANPLRFQIVPAGRLADAHPPAVALKPFAPVVRNKEVKLTFTIFLERVCFSFDGSTMPNLKSADWKPSYATASWVSWSQTEKDGKVTVSRTSSTDFVCKKAAEVTSAGEATCNFCAEWLESQCSESVTKTLKLRPDGSFFDQFIEITVCAADQKPHNKEWSKVRDQKSKEIILGAPVRVNLAVGAFALRPRAVLFSLIFWLQDFVSLDAQGQCCDDGVPKPPCVSAEGTTLYLKIVCQRDIGRATPAAATASATGSSSSSTAPLPTKALAGPVVAAHDLVITPKQFPKPCSFSVTANRDFNESDCCGKYLRICSSDCLALCIGSEFEICPDNAGDRFGKIVNCARISGADVCTLVIDVFMVWLPRSPLQVGAIFSEVYLVFIDKSSELNAEIASRTGAATAAESNAELDCARENFIAKFKERTQRDIDKALHLTQDELGAVLLRAGFLASQSLMSECVHILMKRWYPSTYNDECARAFRSKDPPWDMFYMFDYFRKRNMRSDRSSSSSFSKLLQELGYLGGGDAMYNDRRQRELEQIMERFHGRTCLHSIL